MTDNNFPEPNTNHFWQFGKSGYYYYIGEADGQQGVGRALIMPADAEFQPIYDEGYKAGSYNRMMLINITM